MVFYILFYLINLNNLGIIHCNEVKDVKDELTTLKKEIKFASKTKDHVIKNYRYIIHLLKLIEDKDLAFYNLYMGRIKMALEEYESANYFLEKARELEPNNERVYFNLFKVKMQMSDYESAYSNLQTYDEMCGERADFSLLLSLLERVLTGADKEIDISSLEYFGEIRIKDSEIKNLLSECVTLINNNLFKEAWSKFGEFKALVKSRNYTIDVFSFEVLLTKLIDNKIAFCSDALKNDLLLENVSMDSLDSFIRLSFDYNLLCNEDLMYKIKCIADSNPSKARNLLKFIDKDRYSKEYNLLEGLIDEKERYLQYETTVKNNYDKCVFLGRSAIERRNFDLAYDIYGTGFALTHDSVFKYYMGKSLFKDRRMEEAEHFFLEYLEFGGSKTTKSLLYLMAINNFLGRKEIAYKFYDDMTSLTGIFNPEFEIFAFPVFKSRKKKSKISVKIKEFLRDDNNLNLENFYDYSFKNKISLIEKLFNNGEYNIALKLFNELKPTDKEEKRLVQNIEKNKKLYKAKRK